MTNPNDFHSFPHFEHIDYSILDLKNTYFPETNYSPINIDDAGFYYEEEPEKNFQMDVENSFPDIASQQKDELFFDKTIFAQDFVLDFDAFNNLEPEIPKKSSVRFTITIEIDDAFYVNQPNKESQAPLEEEVTILGPIEDNPTDSHNDMILYSPKERLNYLSPEIETNWRATITDFAQKQPLEEKQYLMKMAPYIMSSLQEALTAHQQRPSFNKKMFESILKDLLYSKEIMLGADNKTIHDLVAEEMENVKASRPVAIFDSETGMKSKRKEKKSIKGHKNHSQMNHMNENYVSNVLRFSKANYPYDTELNKLANERGVSAMTFRKMTRVKLDDDIFVRKAKIRVVASGQELISNIENWMEGGYFESCTDKEKYLQYKEKAITDLALNRQY